MEDKFVIARRIALELEDGDLVNLGIGTPTLVADFIPKDRRVTLQSENGIIGIGPLSETPTGSCNAGGQHATIVPGGSFFDSTLSFSIIRGGHVDVTVLGALEVDAEGSLASWIIPGKKVPGMGGAMDLVVGAKKVIVATTHTNNGRPKILKRCALPLTARREVDLIVTELAVIAVEEGGLRLLEVHPDHTVAEVVALTEAPLRVDGVVPMKGVEKA
ncbi:MAG: 3-oxoacid CoA-transferase subunit B [Candidatus Izemoplasmatales bacterium]